MHFRKWRQQLLARTAYGYAGLTLLWIGVSGGLKALEQSGCVFNLIPIIECKVLAVALVWIGRFLWFPQGRLHTEAKLGCAFCGLLLAASGAVRAVRQLTWGYVLLVSADTLLWAGLATGLLETLFAVYYQRWATTAPHLSRLREEWSLFWTESIKLGLWLTLLLGLVFFYLVSFYHFEVYFYSRIMAAVWIGAELLFYGISVRRLTGEIREKIASLEREISGYLGWQCEEKAELISQWSPVLQYLILSRNYLISLRRPTFSGWTIGGYVALLAFLLGLPRLIGSVTKV